MARALHKISGGSAWYFWSGFKANASTTSFVGSTAENRKPKLITLEPGKTAWFQVYYNDGMALDHKKPYPKAYKFMITAPKGDKAFVMRTEIEPCCGVQVSSIQAEASE